MKFAILSICLMVVASACVARANILGMISQVPSNILNGLGITHSQTNQSAIQGAMDSLSARSPIDLHATSSGIIRRVSQVPANIFNRLGFTLRGTDATRSQTESSETTPSQTESSDTTPVTSEEISASTEATEQSSQPAEETTNNQVQQIRSTPPSTIDREARRSYDTTPGAPQKIRIGTGSPEVYAETEEQ